MASYVDARGVLAGKTARRPRAAGHQFSQLQPTRYFLRGIEGICSAPGEKHIIMPLIETPTVRLLICLLS